MQGPKKRGARIALGVVAALAFVFIGAVLGAALGGQQRLDDMTAVQVASESQDSAGGAASSPGIDAVGDVAAEAVPRSAAEKGSLVAPNVDPMVIKTAAMDIRVDDVTSAVQSIRTDVARVGAQVTDYSITSGESGAPIDATTSSKGPTAAYITIRVPAEKLDALRRQVATVGVVLSESSAASDVTQQYVDMSARLKNLKAEEARLRQFLEQTDKVSELLQVESELSRVRGEIESMQAQLDYLKQQVALSTLSVTLSEPGAIVEPSGADWGFREAITRGIRGAVAIVTLTMTAVIAVAPIALIALAVFLIVRAVVSRSRRSRAGDEDGPAAQDDES